MKIDILLGLQWGDEGKGKLVDAISPDYDVIARFQGGPNAGHSLEFNNIKHILHLIPSGIFHSDKMNIIGNGVVIDPAIFKAEIDGLSQYAPDITRRLVISTRANLILPTHRVLDAASEHRKGASKIGSTLKGIGPAYTDKTGRAGLRVGDIMKHNFRQLYEEATRKHLETLRGFDFTFDLAEYEKGWFEGIEMMKEFKIINTEYYINKLMTSGKSILAEGAQGTMLDVDFGTYPFVTSSNTVSAGACTGLGVAPSSTGDVFGIFKAYCTRVGSGPFPTELDDETGARLRDTGREYGATTGRPRRCGWLDLPALKYAIMLNGVTQLYMTKADVLSGFEKIKICTSYKINGTDTKEIPFENDAAIEPVYKEFNGWTQDISGIREFDRLPSEFKRFTGFIEEYCNVPITIISVGPDREETIFRAKLI